MAPKPKNPLKNLLLCGKSLNQHLIALTNVSAEDFAQLIDEINKNNGRGVETQTVEKKSAAMNQILSILDKYPELEGDTLDILKIRVKRLVPAEQKSKKAKNDAPRE